jgi:uncharacterized membrane protein HdeD (DUF308 family)
MLRAGSVSRSLYELFLKKGNVMNTEVKHELQHLRSSWLWFFLLGIVLIVGGTIAISFPAITSLAAITVLGAVLLVSGIATIISAFWAGKWSGMVVQLLVGFLYIGGGMVVTHHKLITVVVMTVFIAVAFMVLGAFRAVTAMIVRFPYWGWALLNGTITFLMGLVIYRLLEQVPRNSLWVIGLLVGVEMLLNGWTWIMLATAIRRIPEEAAA